MHHLEPTYLRYIYDGLVKGSIHPENAAELPEGLIGLYEEAFDERTSVVERQKLLQRFAVWALLKKEVSAAFVAEVLGDTEDEIQDFISTYSAWFNSPESGKYQLYHERLKVYLLQKLSEGEVHKLTLKIFHRLKIHFDSTLGNECEEYAQYYFLDYYNIVVNLSENLKINSELHQDYFIRVKKDPIRLFYLENGRNHRERHLRQATSYFSRKKDLKVLDQIVHLINRFQNKRSSPVELSKLIWSDNRNDQLYGYNLCSRQEEKLFLLVYSSIYHKELTFSEWHLEVIKEYWKELQPTKKIYDLPSFFLLDLVPFLVDLALFKLEEIEVKKVDFRVVYSQFKSNSFDLFEYQKYDADIFDNYTNKSDILFQLEIEYRKSNQIYFEKIDNLDNLNSNKDLHFLINPDNYFKLPNNKFLFNDWSSDESFTSEFITEIYYQKHRDKNLNIHSIVEYSIRKITANKLDEVLSSLKYLKLQVKFGYARDSEGAIIPNVFNDDSWSYNEMLYSIFGFCLFSEILDYNQLLLFKSLIIKDDTFYPEYFNDLISYQQLIECSRKNIVISSSNLKLSDRAQIVYCNHLYKENKISEALNQYSIFQSIQLNDNEIFYEINFLNTMNLTLVQSEIFPQYYSNSTSIKDSIIPIVKYSLRAKNIYLLWNFLHVNQGEMQKFGNYRSFAFKTISSVVKSYNLHSELNVFLEKIIKEIKPFKGLSSSVLCEESIENSLVEPVESVDVFEILKNLSGVIPNKLIEEFELKIIEIESKDSNNLNNLLRYKALLIGTIDKKWKKSNESIHLIKEVFNLYKEECFIQDYSHHILLLNLYFDHPEYINSIAFYSELFKKYKLKPEPLTDKTRFASDRLIEQLKWKDNLIPLEVSPSNLMYSNFILGQGYFEIEDYKNAIKFFKTAIENREVYSGTILGKCFLELGKSYYYVNNFRMAIENLNLARIKLPKSKDDLNDLSDCYYFLGLSYEENKKWNDSISNYIKCKNIDNRKLEKDHKDHLTVLKSILRISKHFDEKYHIKYINALIINLKSDSQLNNHEIGYYYLTLARKYRENEDFNSELKSLRKCVKHLNSSNYRTNESRIKIYFLLAKSYEKNMHFLKALKTVKNIENEIANIITENDINSMIARCAFKAKKFKLSLEYYLKIDNDDSNPLISFKIAYCYEQISSVNKAFHYYLNYLEKKSEDDMFLNLFKELGDEDFIDFSEDELIKALDFIESHSSKKSKIDNWIQKLIELKNANN